MNRLKIQRIALTGAFWILAIGAAAIAQAQTQPTPREQLLVSTDWLMGQLDNPDLIVVHVARTPDGYRSGHVPGARFLNRAEVGNDRNGLSNEFPPEDELVAAVQRLGIGETSRVIVYDEAAGLDAARAFVAFDYLGFGDRTALLDGQLKKWKAENRSLSTETPAVRASAWTPSAHPELLLNAKAMQDLSAKAKSEGSGVDIVDARPEAQYKGEQASTGIRAGHIPGAQCVFWQANIASQENPVMRPIEELRELYKGIAHGPNNTVATYCNSGGQASFSYFALRYLGYNVRFYDGSMQDWSRTEGAPVETSQ
jgi:thiosulfate/3-mercaptopyruvate sulfurtransferase